MAQALSIKEQLQKKIRESSLSGGEVLRSLDKAVSKLEDFVKIMQPMQEAVNKLGEVTSNIDKALSEVRDHAQALRESNSLVKNLQSPSDSRTHLKNIERALSLIQYYQSNPTLAEGASTQEKLAQALTVGYTECVKLIEEQITKYNEIYGISVLANENTAQIDMIETIRELVDICKIKAPGYWASYVKLRSGLLHKSILIPPRTTEPYIKDSHYIITILRSFVKCCEAEQEFLSCILGTQTVQDWLGEVTEVAFQFLSSSTETFLMKKSHITLSLDILSIFHHSLPAIESYLGKSVKYYTISKLQSSLLQRCQSWYREYIQSIQSSKLDFGDFVHEYSLSLFNDLKLIMKYSSALSIAKLEQSIAHLVTSLIDTYRLKTKSSKQQGLGHVFMINNLCYWINALQELEFVGLEDVMGRIEKEMNNELEEYCKDTWSKLVPILSDQPTVIEFKKPGVLTAKSRKAVKNKLKSFNTVYPEIFNYHKNYSMYSREIMQLLRRKHFAIVAPAYKEFLNRYLAVDFTTRREKYTLFSVEAVENGIMNMYVLKKVQSS